MGKVNHNYERSLNIKLAKIEIEKFSGKLDNWLRFFETFSSIVDKYRGLSDLQKFHYLVVFLEGEAADLVGGIEISEENYRFAGDKLVNRYKNDKRLIENHIGNVFNLKSIANQSSKDLSELCNVFQKNLNAINKLNVELNGCDQFVVYLIGTKLDSGTLRAWEEETGGTKEMPSYKRMQEFLEKNVTG